MRTVLSTAGAAKSRIARSSAAASRTARYPVVAMPIERRKSFSRSRSCVISRISGRGRTGFCAAIR
jgi:hypothetical protein